MTSCITPSPMKVITYSRVSTSHHDQKPEIQVEELRQYCKARGWTIKEEIVDHGYSGGTDQRPGLKRLMTLARSRQIDVVVVTKLDRMARSLRHFVAVLDEFSSLGVQFVSVKDQIDLTTASGRLMLHIVAAFSEFERSLIRERTIAGLAYAVSKGRKLGRPLLHNPNTIRDLRTQGMSYRNISKKLNVPMGAITRAIKSAHKTSTSESSKSSMKTGDKNV